MKRSTIALCLALASITVALAACGSTTTNPATPSGAPATSGAPTSSAAPPTAAEFKAYVDALKPVVAQVQASSTALSASLAKLTPKPGNGWDTVAIELTQQGVFLGQASDALAKITPPAAFAELQNQAIQGLLLRADAVRAVGSMIAGRTFDPNKIDPAVATQLKQASAVTEPWKKALSEQSAALGVPLPWTWQK
jgi:hypothetical protein